MAGCSTWIAISIMVSFTVGVMFYFFMDRMRGMTRFISKVRKNDKNIR